MPKDPKFPPGPPGPPGPHPCGPWPSVFPPRPPHMPDGVWPGRPWFHNDTEPVIGVRPWENCCEDQDPCVCVTSADVENWYGALSALSANSATWDSNAFDDSWKDSAADWQGAYDTVEQNSAFWNSAWEIAHNYDSGNLDGLAALVAKSSAFLVQYYGQDIFKTDITLQGNGSQDHPLGLADEVKVIVSGMRDALNDLYGGANWGVPDYRTWVNWPAYEELKDWVQQHDDLLWKVQPKVHDEHYGEPDGVFPQLAKIWEYLKGIPSSGGGGGDDSWKDSAADWQGAYEVVSANSGAWSEGDQSWKDSAGFWEDTCEFVSANSAAWFEGDNSWRDSAENWQGATEAVSANSAYWNSGSHMSWKPIPDGVDYHTLQEPNTIYYSTYNEG